MIQYKQKCFRCRKNMIIVTSRTRYAVCYECQKNEMNGEIKDPQMQKMFSIPEELYQQSSFLRSIKINYLKYGKLTEKQIDAFKKAVDKLQNK